MPSAASSFVLCCDPYCSKSVLSETELIIQQRWTLLRREVFLLLLIASARYDRPHRLLPAEHSWYVRAIQVVYAPGRTWQSRAGSKDGDWSLTRMEMQTLCNQFAGQIKIWKQTQGWLWFVFAFTNPHRRWESLPWEADVHPWLTGTFKRCFLLSEQHIPHLSVGHISLSKRGLRPLSSSSADSQFML